MTLLRFYREGERRSGVDWEVLAAVNFVETGFSQSCGARSLAGAQGPMQFMPATWRAYGLGGSVHDPRDAILGAANYLRVRSGARPTHRALALQPLGALCRRRHGVRRADVRDPAVFLQYHAWQVFVKHPSGPRRLTGP